MVSGGNWGKTISREWTIFSLCAGAGLLWEVILNRSLTLEALWRIALVYGLVLLTRGLLSGLWCFVSNARARRTAWRRCWVSLAVALVLATLAITLFLIAVPLGYTATSEIRIRSVTPRIMGEPKDDMDFGRLVATHRDLMTSDHLLERVLDRFWDHDIPSLHGHTEPLEYLRKNITAEQRGESELVTVSCWMPSRADAELVLEELLRAYFEFVHTEGIEQGSERLKVLIDEREVLQAQLELQICRIAELRDSLGLTANGVAWHTGDILAKLRGRIDANQDELFTANSAKRHLQALLDVCVRADRPIYQFEVEDRVQSDVRIIELTKAVIAKEIQLAGMLEPNAEGSPEGLVLQKGLDALKEKLATTRVSIRKEMLTSLLREREAQVEALEPRLAESSEKLAALEKDAHRTEQDNQRTKAQLDELEYKNDWLREKLATVNHVIDDILREEKAPPRIIKSADVTVPEGPDLQWHLRVIALIAFVALGVGVGAGASVRPVTEEQSPTEEGV